MDFSYLDLLASTALRENSSSQADSTTAQPNHPQPNDHDSPESEDDDDEADGKTDVKFFSETVGEDNLDKMGSVKCGKPKKNSGKSVSIFVRDGKCVGKKIHTSDTPSEEKVGADVTGLDKSVQEKVTSLKSQDLCQNNNSAQSVLVLKCADQTHSTKELRDDGEPRMCNGVNNTNHVSPTAVNNDVKSEPSAGDDDAPVSHHLSSTETEPKSSEASAAVSSGYPQCQDQSDVLQPQGDTKSASDVVSDNSPPCVSLTANEAQVTGEDVAAPSETNNSDPSDSVSRKEGSSAVDPVHVESPGLIQANDKVPALSQTYSAQTCLPCDAGNTELTPRSSAEKVEEAMETKDGCNCDEDCPVLPCPPAQDIVGVQGQDSPCTDNVDQDMGSSGNKLTDPPSSSSVDPLLTPPPPILPPPPQPLPISAEIVFMDHCYSGNFDKLKQSVDNTDDSGDAFESADENVSADEIEHRPRSLSVDSVYLQQGQSGSLPQQDGLLPNEKLSLLSPTLSVDSISNDSSMSEHSSATGGQCYSILSGCPNPTRTALQQNLSSGDSQGGGDNLSLNVGGTGRLNFNSSLLDVGSSPSIMDNSGMGTVTPKCGKFRIGTFGSFSNSHLDLDKDTKKTKLKIGLLSESVMKNSLSSPAIASPASPFPLLQSPSMEWDRSDAGSEAPDDLDSSTTEDKFLSSSHDSEAFGAACSQIWNHPVFHDHDYCCKEISEKYLGKPAAPVAQTRGGKRKYGGRKKERQDMEEEKLKKGKYLKRELLKQDNRFNLGSGGGADSRGLAAKSSLLAESLTSKPNPVGRPRKRNDRQLEEYDAETGTKMKITGKYQDQYVYYLNKSSRNRRRKLDEKMPPGDKIILPAPKPGDIVVPHLTDAECEAIRFGGRSALLNHPLAPGGSAHTPHADGGDMDSSIVNYILSMETEHSNIASPLDSYDGDSEDFGDIEGKLTSEQVKMLFDCLDNYHIEDATTSQAMDLLTSAEDVSVPPAAVNSMAPTTVEEDFLVPEEGKTGPGNTSTQQQAEEVKLDSAETTSGSEALPAILKQEGECSNAAPVLSTGLPAPPTSQPSVEKNLEFLKTPITKSDFFPSVSTISSSCASTDFSSAPSSTLMMPNNTEKAEDVNETPWIVTVTLYWNDIPAIIINNMPHVRLVDIHRQILPAKDTGILKKRCQLMNIQVTNCSEMQRYFLVQYGRAHNSKSTLVISKDEAQRLISYYAHPPPRNLRGEDTAGLRRSTSYAELRSYMETPSHPNRHSALAFTQPRKRGGFRRRGVAGRSHNPSPEPVGLSAVLQGSDRSLPTTQPMVPASPVKGLRHKKINFREMLKGEDSSPHSSPSLDSQSEEPLALESVSFPKSRGAKAGSFHKRRRNKEAGGPTAKRGRRDQRRKDEQRELSQSLLTDQTEPDILVDGDSPDSSSVVNTKGKKRSPGSAANGSLSTSGRSPKSKFGPIKVNVKSLVHAASAGGQPRKKNLFGRKSSVTDHVVVDVADEEIPRSHPLRLLRISHQEMEGVPHSSPRMLSPTAEVHLDLYKRSASPCVKCSTCAKFLSVPGFLQHHHTSSRGENSVGEEDSTEDGSMSSLRRRMLVPMNKENISVEEQQLWNEFVALQERLDQAVSICSMGAYPLTPLSPASPVGSSSVEASKGGKMPTSRPDTGLMTPELQGHGLHNGHVDSVSALDCQTTQHLKGVVSLDSSHGSSVGSVDLTDSLPTGTAANPWETPISVCSPPPSLPVSATHTEKEEKLDSADVDQTPILSFPKSLVPSKKQQQMLQRHRTPTPSANIRTSSRKRETKRLYSFEKYEFGGGKKNARGEIDCHDSVEDLPDTPVEEDVDGFLMGHPSPTLPAGAILQESLNA